MVKRSAGYFYFWKAFQYNCSIHKAEGTEGPSENGTLLVCSEGLVYLKPGELLLSGGNFGFQPFPDVLISEHTFRLLSKFFG